MPRLSNARRLAVLLVSGSLFALASAQPKWNIAYQHDQDESTLFLRAIEFPSEQRGIAVGVLNDKGRSRNVALVTADGGNSWEPVKLKDEPVALACHTDAVCWIATPKNVWRTEEGGREWKKISNIKGVLNLQFVSPTHGWAVGAQKSAWETTDGGKTWNLLPALKDVNANPSNASFMALSMHGQIGMIGGNSRPPRKGDSPFPDWMIPDEAAKRREWPAMMILLETRDGGKTWKSSTNSVFGTLTTLRIQPEGRAAAALLEYFHSFETPSEVMFVDFKTGRSHSVFRNKGVAVTDLLLLPGESAVLAGTEATGLRSLPIPQKVRFFEAALGSAAGLEKVTWQPLDVDYRVTAQRVRLARKPGGQLWAVTDTGFILRLDRPTPDSKPRSAPPR